MTIEKMPWGRSIEILEGPKAEEGRTVESAGVNFIEPGQMIPFHLHDGITEDYIPQTEGLRIIVLSKKEATELSADEIIEKVKSAVPSEIGDVVTCPNGYGHALFNSSSTQGAFVFEKYD